MDISVTTLAGKDAGKVKVSEAIFGLEPRDDILQRVVRWQLAKKQQGSHKTLGRSEISRTVRELTSSCGIASPPVSAVKISVSSPLGEMSSIEMAYHASGLKIS